MRRKIIQIIYSLLCSSLIPIPGLSQEANSCDTFELGIVCYFEVQESLILNGTIHINSILENPSIRVINPHVLCEASVHKFTLSGLTKIDGENTYWEISSEGNEITEIMISKMIDKIYTEFF